MASLKTGTPLFFVADNLYPYWEPVPNAYKMDRVFENVLEGNAHSWGYGVPEQNKFRWKMQFADDADEASIPPSKKGSPAGAYANLTETDIDGTLWIKVDFPFTFYNRDGDNHDTETTIQAWVKSEEVAQKKDSSQTLKELSDSLGLNPDTGLTGAGGTSATSSSSTTILIIVAAVLVIGGVMIFAFRKPKQNPMMNQAQNGNLNQNSGINVIRIPKSK